MSSPAANRPSRTRFVVLAYLCSLAFILYVDRICIAQAETSIRAELGLEKSHMAFVLAAFTLAYGLFEVPTGNWADRVGSRRVVTRISIWWSIFTALTGACQGFGQLLVVRFLFGAGEAGAFPNAARIFSRWFPASERGRAQGLLNCVALLGGAASPMVATFLIQRCGWRWTFVIFGSLGIVWAGVFYRWFRDEPEEHPSVNSQELAWIHSGRETTINRQHGAIPWRLVFRSRAILLLGFVMACASWNSYIYFSWFSTYLQEARQVSLTTAGRLASLVLAGGAIGGLCGGWVSDRLVRLGGDVRLRRRRFASSVFALAAILVVAAMLSEAPVQTSGLLALSCLCATSTLASWWASAIEVSGRHIGALFGLMNGCGVFGAMASQFFFGTFPDLARKQGFLGRAQWDPCFYLGVGVLLTAAIGWSFIDTSRAIDAEQPGS